DHSGRLTAEDQGPTVTLPEPLIWSGVADTVAVHVRSLHAASVKLPLATPSILPFQPTAAPPAVPRPIVICVPPPMTCMPMIRADFAADGGGGGGGGGVPP